MRILENKTDEELCVLIKQDNLEARNEMWIRYYSLVQRFIPPSSSIKDPGLDDGKCLEWLLNSVIEAAKKYKVDKKKPFKALLLSYLKKTRFFSIMVLSRTPRASHRHYHLNDLITDGDDIEVSTDNLFRDIATNADSEDKFLNLAKRFVNASSLNVLEMEVLGFMLNFGSKSIREMTQRLNEKSGLKMTDYQIRKAASSIRTKLKIFLTVCKAEKECWCC